MMETVIVMPIILLLIFMIIQFAHVWIARQMVVYAAYCGARSMMTVVPQEQYAAASNAVEIALSWICLADNPNDKNETRLVVPGWGEIPGSGSRHRRITTTVLGDGVSDDRQFVGVRVEFKFPLLIPGMGVNAILGNQVNDNQDGVRPTTGDETDFYRNLATMADKPVLIDGWPYITFRETCVLPMPYSTRNFPKGGYELGKGPTQTVLTDYYVQDANIRYEWHSDKWNGQNDFEVNGL